jgi:hypothetical protein
MRLVEKGGELVIHDTLPDVRQALLGVLDLDILVFHHSLVDIVGLLPRVVLSAGALDLLPRLLFRLLLRLLLDRLGFGSLFLGRLDDAATATLSNFRLLLN